MYHPSKKKQKIFNDPVYGFITIPYELAFDLINHPYFQRLRHISQLGLSNIVYPSALHTRFSHAIGAMHLMTLALETLQAKGHEITEEEAEAVTIAILLHDIGHGPFSHALEFSLVDDVNHEFISSLFMERLNKVFNGKLTLAINIFTNKYHKCFLHQLISGELDVDRLDYLKRDSFFTGVQEGIVGYERIISMLNVANNQLVVDNKGLYALEKFITARRIMYWQVYMHKTVVSAQNLLINILKRAKELSKKGEKLFATTAFNKFLYNKFTKKDFLTDTSVLDTYSAIDDFDVFSAIKTWTTHHDIILSKLSSNLINRKLYKIKIQNEPIDNDVIKKINAIVQTDYNLKKDCLDYFVFTGTLRNEAYSTTGDRIKILFSDDKLLDIADASDNLNFDALFSTVEKYYICYPNEMAVLI